QRAVFPGVQRALAARGRALRALPRADQEIRAPVAVHVADVGGADAEAVAGSFAGEREQALVRATRVHVDAARARTAGVVLPVGGVDVGIAVAVHVARDRQEHRAECDTGRIG